MVEYFPQPRVASGERSGLQDSFLDASAVLPGALKPIRADFSQILGAPFFRPVQKLLLGENLSHLSLTRIYGAVRKKINYLDDSNELVSRRWYDVGLFVPVRWCVLAGHEI